MSTTVRVTPNEVKTIIDTDLDNLVPFINAANMLVDKMLADEDEMDENQKKQIELWLSAHFVAIRDPVLQREKIGDAQADYWLGTVEGAKGLLMTPYGQMACTLDTSGRLSTASKRRAEVLAIDLDL